MTSRPVLIAGSAWTLDEDLGRARTIWPHAPIVAVNDASRLVKAFALVSQHPERFETLGWVRKQRRFFGDDFTTHSNSAPADVVWDLPSRGGSAWLARRIMGVLGFDPVVLCGCPMEPGHYSGYTINGLMHQPEVVDELFGQIERDAEWHHGCVSMSGRTKALLG